MKALIKNYKGLKNYNAAQIKQIALEMQESRNKTFIAKDNGSWQKDGIVGAWLNLKRKIDTALEKSSNGDVSTFQALSDMIKAAEMYTALLYLKAVQASDDATAVRFHETFK